jgi:hypothetical protein
MTLVGVAAEPCDSLYVGPSVDDVVRSCAARLVADAKAGHVVTVVSVFGDAHPPASVLALSGLGVRVASLGLPDAARRDPVYAFFPAAATGRGREDDRLVEDAAERLGHAAHQTRARTVYVPLGVGGHIDRRVVFEAALRAMHSGEGRDVFLYEDRPDAVVRGAVRIRLGQVGARLPPGAAEAADHTQLPALMMRAHVAPFVRGEARGWRGRLQAAGVAARHWRDARSWHPQRGFGPRLHPVIHRCQGDDTADAQALVRAARSEAGSRLAGRLESLARRYARRLAGGGYAERYWLLLPERGERPGDRLAVDVPA